MRLIGVEKGDNRWKGIGEQDGWGWGNGMVGGREKR